MQTQASSAAVVYAAKSTEDRHGSLPTQLADCRAMALREGWDVVGEYQDEGFSAYKGNRGPALEAAKRKAAEIASQRGGCMLVAQHSDRFARGAGDRPGAAAHLAEVFFEMRRLGVRLRSVQDDANLDNPLLVAMIGERNTEDSKRKSLSTRAGMERRAKSGKHHGGLVPFGYRHGGEACLIVVPHHAEIVRRIYREFLAGKSQAAIARDLDRENVTTARGGKWHQGTVSAILRNPVYKGEVRFDDQTFPGHHEPIVSAETWEQAATLCEAASRTRGRGRRPAGRHLFTKGMLRCGECGEAMVPRADPNRAGPPSEVYYCYGRKRGGTDFCSTTPLRRSMIDTAVYSYFEQVGLDVEATRAELAAAVDARVREIRSLRKGAERDEREASECLARVRRHFKKGKLSPDDWVEFREELTDELEAATAKLARLRDQERQVVEGSELRDVEEETLRLLAEVRHMIAGRVNRAQGIDGVRAALLQLFDGFTLHRASSKAAPTRVHADLAWLGNNYGYLIEPHVRPQVVEGYTEKLTPILRREPLQQAENKYAVGFTT
jgi:DNA invertase Pin-like site-specific DNA recombinase